VAPCPQRSENNSDKSRKIIQSGNIRLSGFCPVLRLLDILPPASLTGGILDVSFAFPCLGCLTAQRTTVSTNCRFWISGLAAFRCCDSSVTLENRSLCRPLVGNDQRAKDLKTGIPRPVNGPPFLSIQVTHCMGLNRYCSSRPDRGSWHCFAQTNSSSGPKKWIRSP